MREVHSGEEQRTGVFSPVVVMKNRGNVRVCEQGPAARVYDVEVGSVGIRNLGQYCSVIADSCMFHCVL